MQVRDIIAACDALLEPGRFQDYAPNGLQVEGSREVRKIVTGVTASLALIEEARRRQADMILVHHGWFWRREDPRIIGVRHRRIAALLASGMALAAYHLPLDDHPEIGNNALLGQALGFEAEGRFGEGGLGWIGRLAQTTDAAALAALVEHTLGRRPLVVGPAGKPLRRVAWCSGAAQHIIEDAAAAGADCFISGEISESTTHIAREAGIVYLACGHHATERLGIQALGRWLAQHHRLEVEFVDIDNPA